MSRDRLPVDAVLLIVAAVATAAVGITDLAGRIQRAQGSWGPG